MKCVICQTEIAQTNACLMLPHTIFVCCGCEMRAKKIPGCSCCVAGCDCGCIENCGLMMWVAGEIDVPGLA